MMKAAVLHALGEAPSYEGFAEPTPNKDETLVSVRAASLKNSGGVATWRPRRPQTGAHPLSLLFLVAAGAGIYAAAAGP